MNVNLLICPNANHGPPHVGHLWYYAHVLYLMDEYERIANLQGWDCEVGLRVLFDVHSKPELEDYYVYMLNWMGRSVDGVDRMKDMGWKTVMQLQYTGMTPAWMDSVCNYWHFADIDPEGRAVKLWYFNQHNVYWHVRGSDLYPEKLADRQVATANRLRLPFMWYIPLLYDDITGEKIGGEQVQVDYRIHDLFDKHPSDVMSGMFKSLGLKGIEDCYPGRLQPFHALIDKEIRVPSKWRDLIHPHDDTRVEGDNDL